MSSRFLESLSAAFLVDAKDFFADFYPTQAQNSTVIPWENLRELALTSHVLHQKMGPGKIKRLLMAAGRAAGFMPKLEVMEIWNGGEGHLCLFRYNNNAGNRQITWAGNWGTTVQFGYDVINCWENVPNHGQHVQGNLTTTVRGIPVKRKLVKTYVNAIRHLKLRKNILDLISDYQVRWEEYERSKA